MRSMYAPDVIKILVFLPARIEHWGIIDVAHAIGFQVTEITLSILIHSSVGIFIQRKGYLSDFQKFLFYRIKIKRLGKIVFCSVFHCRIIILVAVSGDHWNLDGRKILFDVLQ